MKKNEKKIEKNEKKNEKKIKKKLKKLWGVSRTNFWVIWNQFPEIYNFRDFCSLPPSLSWQQFHNSSAMLFQELIFEVALAETFRFSQECPQLALNQLIDLASLCCRHCCRGCCQLRNDGAGWCWQIQAGQAGYALLSLASLLNISCVKIENVLFFAPPLQDTISA